MIPRIGSSISQSSNGPHYMSLDTVRTASGIVISDVAARYLGVLSAQECIRQATNWGHLQLDAILVDRLKLINKMAWMVEESNS